MARARGNGEECDESKRGMSAQRVAKMLLACFCRSNVQLLLCLRLPHHTLISTQALGYGPLQWADCQLPWITISKRVLGAIRRRGPFHIEYSCCFTGYNRLENSQADNEFQTWSWINRTATLLKSTLKTGSVVFFTTRYHIFVELLPSAQLQTSDSDQQVVPDI